MQTTVPEHWLGVEPRHLATFAAVAEAGSFRRAAAELGYVQSAVSQQVAQLERALGTRLIERGRGSELRLTRSGRTLLVHARRIVDHMRAACADVAYLAGAEPVRVAVEPAAMALLPELSAPLAGGDGTGISVFEVPAARQPELVAAGAVDVALGAFPDLGPGLARRVVATDSWVLVVPTAAWPDAQDAHTIDSIDLRGTAIIEDRSHPLPVCWDRFGATRVIGCDRIAHALGLVRAGAGCAILPRLGVADGEPGVRCLELGDRMPSRPVSLIWLAARRLPGELAALGPEPAAAGRLAGAA